MIRLTDFLFSILLLLILSPILILVFILCYFDLKSPIFIQQRVGINLKIFSLYKFRTMNLETPNIPSHKVDEIQVTKIGALLRRSKLDELPQLINVFKGDMSLVGPRPSLPNQKEVIEERKKLGVLNFKPGITGLSQINGLDMSKPKLLAENDYMMMQKMSFLLYLKVIFLTLIGKGKGDRVKKSKKLDSD